MCVDLILIKNILNCYFKKKKKLRLNSNNKKVKIFPTVKHFGNYEKVENSL